MAHRAQTAAGANRHQPCSKKAEMTELIAIAVTAAILALFAMAPRSRKRRIGGPIFGWFMIFASHAGFDRAKKTAAIMKKTVLGMTGRKAPTIPRPTKNRPANMKRIRMCRP